MRIGGPSFNCTTVTLHRPVNGHMQKRISQGSKLEIKYINMFSSTAIIFLNASPNRRITCIVCNKLGVNLRLTLCLVQK